MSLLKENILRVLRFHGLEDSVIITMEDEDRVWGWPIGDTLRDYCRSHDWFVDLKCSSEHYHGQFSTSYREPDSCHPALQVIFHPDQERGVFVEMDLDESAPVDIVSGLWHLWEVVKHSLTGTKTDQKRISKLLDKRFKA